MKTATKRSGEKTQTRVADNPLEGEQLLLDALYGPAARRPPARVDANRRPKPEHYKVVSISLYTEDIERLEGFVAELKARGHTKANKSAVIRQALAQLDLDRIPRAR